MGPGTLEGILKRVPVDKRPEVLVGLEIPDDAGVYKLNEEIALIQTVDFFTPVVDDPYLFGQIAAANALSDIYAMGGRPLTAMNVVCFPTSCLDIQVLGEILAGGSEMVHRAGAVILGGHTVEDVEPKYGLSVTGIGHPEKIITNQGAMPGDLLVLTKPLGTGVLITAVKGGVISDSEARPAYDAMSRLNKIASECMQELGVRGATDITGFGFLGHAYEMAAGSRCTFEVWVNQMPWLPQARDMAGMGLIPAGAYVNQGYLKGKVIFRGVIEERLVDLLFDPQTSGGLLIAISEERVQELLNKLHTRGEEGWVVGRVSALGDHYLEVCGK
mgnify:CR=1 FL=1